MQLNTHKITPVLEKYYPGIAVSLVIAASATFLSEHYGAPVMLFALLIGIAFHFLMELPACSEGIEFSARQFFAGRYRVIRRQNHIFRSGFSGLDANRYCAWADRRDYVKRRGVFKNIRSKITLRIANRQCRGNLRCVRSVGGIFGIEKG